MRFLLSLLLLALLASLQVGAQSTGAALSSSSTGLPASTGTVSSTGLPVASTGSTNNNLFLCDADQTCGSDGKCTPLKSCDNVSCGAGNTCWNAKCVPGSANSAFTCMAASSTAATAATGLNVSSTGSAVTTTVSTTTATTTAASSSTGLPLPSSSSTGVSANVPSLPVNWASNFPSNACPSGSSLCDNLGNIMVMASESVDVEADELMIQCSVVIKQTFQQQTTTTTTTTTTANATGAMTGVESSTSASSASTGAPALPSDAALLNALVPGASNLLNGVNNVINSINVNSLLSQAGLNNGQQVMYPSNNDTNTLIAFVQSSVAKNANDLISFLQTNTQVSKLQTTGISLSPDFDFSNGGQRLTGYTGTNSISFRVSPISAASNLLPQLLNHGATQIDSLTFIASDAKLEQAKADAIQKASNAAKGQIDAAVAALDTLGGNGNAGPQSLDFVNLAIASVMVNEGQSFMSTSALPSGLLGLRDAILSWASLLVPSLGSDINNLSMPILGGMQTVTASVQLTVRPGNGAAAPASSTAAAPASSTAPALSSSTAPLASSSSSSSTGV